MSAPFCSVIAGRLRSAMMSLAGVVIVCTAVNGQTSARAPGSKPAATQPTGPTHAERLAAAAKNPILTTRYRPADAKPLTDEEKAQIAKSDGLLRQAEQSRQGGDYETAARQAADAAAGYKRVLGDQHYLIVAAGVAARTLERFAKADAADRKKLAEADAAYAASGEAYLAGDYAAAVTAAKKAAQIREDLVGRDHAEVGLALFVQGKAEIEARELSSALQSLNRAFSILEREYGERHPRTALVHDRLGWLKLQQVADGAAPQAVMDQAAQHLRRAVVILSNTVGETRETAEAQDNLGTVEYFTRDIERALHDKLRALHVRSQVLGPEDRDTGVSLSNIGWLYDQIGLRDEALDLRKRALAVFEKSLGREHPYSRAETLNLAAAYQRRSMWDESVKLLEGFVGSGEGAAKQAPNVESAEAFGRLGLAYLQKGRPQDAERSFNRAFDGAVALYKAGDPLGAVAAMDRLAGVYQQRRMFEDAVRLYEQVRAWDQPGTDSEGAARVRRAQQLAALYLEVGRYQDAQKILEDATARTEKLYGQDSLESAAVLRLLAMSHEKLGRLAEAEKLCDQALRITENKLPRDAPARVYAAAYLGRILVQEGKLDLAKFFIEEAKEIIAPHEQDNPALLIQMRLDEAQLCSGLGQKAEAIKLLREALDCSRREVARAPGAVGDAALAQCLKRLGDELPRENPEQQKEAETLKSELKTVLERLRDGRALNAENKRWLEELKS